MPLMWWVFKFLTALNLIIFRFWEILYTADYTVISKYAIAVSLMKSFVMHGEKRILFQTLNENHLIYNLTSKTVTNP